MTTLWDEAYSKGDDNASYDELCHNSKPTDFYFAVNFFDGETSIAIVPQVFFDEEGYMWDQHMDLDHILPDDFSEAMESVWVSDRLSRDVRADMLARGFVENDAITTGEGDEMEDD